MNESSTPGLGLQLGSTALALVLVLALAWAVLRLIKRLQTGRAAAAGTSVPQVLHSVSLGPRERLVSVRHRGREYLLGVTAGAINVIDADVRPESAAAAMVNPSPYGQP